MDASTRTALEALYNVLLSAVVLLARALNKPCPVITRETRREDARALLDRIAQR